MILGELYWESYAVDADIAPSDASDAGLIARVSDPEWGMGSYSGVYVGLRVRDRVFLVGVADHGWNEKEARSLPRPIISRA